MSVPTRQGKPEWLKITHKRGDEYRHLRDELKQRKLHTVCEEASCPNLNECWALKTATIMILGETCTRGCRFCHVNTGHPHGVIDPREAVHSSELVGLMNLSYVVITSVDRDDLPDHGAGHFAAVISQIRADNPQTKVEALVPDFDADPGRMTTLAQASPFVVAQNIETVERLTHPVRDPRAGYEKTLTCLDYYKKQGLRTKTSLMVGLGETDGEIEETLRNLRSVGTDILTLGQYLQPTSRHWPVKKFYTPQEFQDWKKLASDMGFSFVASGPLVRSSYRAADYLNLWNKEGK